jgi:hypothetical protein
MACYFMHLRYVFSAMIPWVTDKTKHRSTPETRASQRELQAKSGVRSANRAWRRSGQVKPVPAPVRRSANRSCNFGQPKYVRFRRNTSLEAASVSTEMKPVRRSKSVPRPVRRSTNRSTSVPAPVRRLSHRNEFDWLRPVSGWMPLARTKHLFYPHFTPVLYGGLYVAPLLLPPSLDLKLSLRTLIRLSKIWSPPPSKGESFSPSKGTTSPRLCL